MLFFVFLFFIKLVFQYYNLFISKFVLAPQTFEPRLFNDQYNKIDNNYN